MKIRKNDPLSQRFEKITINFESFLEINEDWLMDEWDDYKYEKYCGELFHHDDIDFWNQSLYEDMAYENYFTNGFLVKFPEETISEVFRNGSLNPLSSLKEVKEFLEREVSGLSDQEIKNIIIVEIKD